MTKSTFFLGLIVGLFMSALLAVLISQVGF